MKAIKSFGVGFMLCAIFGVCLHTAQEIAGLPDWLNIFAQAVFLVGFAAYFWASMSEEQ